MKNNIIFKFVLMSVMLTILVTVLSLYNLRNTSINAAIEKAEAISEAVKSGLTSHMINNTMNQSDTFINSISNMKNVNNLWLSRTDLVSKQYGSNQLSATPKDDIETKVLQTGKMHYELKESISKTTMRITIPYNAVATKGIDCLSCHNVNYGSTLGAVSLELDISDVQQLGIETIFAITLLVILGVLVIVFLVKKILNPYQNLLNDLGYSLKKSTTGNFHQIKLNYGLAGDEIELAENYNKVMKIFSDTSNDIDKKLKGFIGHKSGQ
ncbi:MAG: hypothetical protein HRT43_09625, partial [Campylobacteraceae bacterium]|nr:hypothetical protein [Campylobacteraceae bacterium]